MQTPTPIPTAQTGHLVTSPYPPHGRIRGVAIRAGAGAIIATMGMGLTLGCTAGGRASPAPELVNLTDTPGDVYNEWTISVDLARRGIVDDILRFWHADRPTRLEPLPIPY